MSDARWVSAAATNIYKVGNWSAFDDAPSAESSTTLQGWEAVGEATDFGAWPTAIPTGAETDTSYIRKNLGALTGKESITYPLEAPNNVSSSLVLWGGIPAMKVKRNVAGAACRAKLSVMTQSPVNAGVLNVEMTPLLDPADIEYTVSTWINGTVARQLHLSYGQGIDVYGTNNDIPNSIPLALRIYDSCTKVDNITEIWEIGLLLQYATRPTTSISSVTGLNSSLSPVINYTFADGDGGSLDWAHVVIHTATGLTNPAAINSGYVHNAIYESPDTALKIGAGNISSEPDDSVSALEPGTTYYAYVRVGKTMSNGVKIMSAWTAATSFTITAAKPATPTLTAAFNSTYEKVLATITDNNNQLSWDNCSFESGIADWQLDANVDALTVVNTAPTADHGDFSLRIDPTSTSVASVMCGQSIPVKPSTSYSITARARKATGTAAVGVAIRWFDANGAVISTSTYSSTTPSTSAWTTTTTTATSPANAVSATVMFRFTPASGTDYCYLDTVAFGSGTTFGPGLSAVEYELQRSADQLTWYPVAQTPIPEQLWGVGRISDYGAPRGAVAYYRARISGEAQGVRQYSDWATANDTAASNTYWRMSEVPSAPIAKVVRAQVTATNVAQLTTAEPHGLATGDTVLVTNTNTTFNYNGTYTVRSVVAEDKFTFVVTSGTVAESIAGGYAERILTDRDLLVTGMDLDIEENVGVFRPLGERGSVYVSSGAHQADGSFSVITTTKADWDTLEPLLYSDQLLVLTHPDGTNHWIKMTGRSWRAMGAQNKPVREVQCSYAGMQRY